MNYHENNQDHWNHAARRWVASQIDIDPYEFYQEIIIPSGLFDQAIDIFPGYNSDQSLDAADWMITQIENSVFSPDDPIWESIIDDIYEYIINGLT